MDEILIYKNRFNKVKAYSVQLAGEGEDYFYVFDKKENQLKTFKKENILARSFDNISDAEKEAEILQKNYEIKKRRKGQPRGDRNNRESKLEVCFTGFKEDKKEELKSVAEKENLFVRTDVTKNLDLLVCGETPGPRKIEKARKANVAIVNSEEGFMNFLETGEVAE